MTNTERDIKILCDYLGVETAPEIIYTRAASDLNKAKPRQFAYVETEVYAIHTCPSMDLIPPAIRAGLLLHELGHIFGGMDEVKADEWVLQNAPDSGYTYIANLRYVNAWRQPVTAQNIQTVSEVFTISAMGYGD